MPLENSQVVWGAFFFFPSHVCFVSDVAAELQKLKKKRMLEVVATGNLGLQLAFSGIVNAYFASCCQLDVLSKDAMFN